MPRTMTFRASLLRNLVPMIVLLGAAILGASFIGSRKGLQHLAEQLTNQAAERVSIRLDAFIDPIRRQLHQVDSWGREGLLTTESHEQKLKLIYPIMEEYDRLYAISLTDNEGRHGVIYRDGDRIIARIVTPQGNGFIAQEFSISGIDRELVEAGQPFPVNDPRVHPSFESFARQSSTDDLQHDSAEHGADIAWLRPHPSREKNMPVTAAAVVYDVADGRTVVVEFAILLEQFSAFTADIQVGRGGQCMIMADNGVIVGLPRHEAFRTPQERDVILRQYLQPRDLGLPLTNAADKALGTGPEANESSQVTPRIQNKPIRLVVDGQAWWAEARPYALSPRQKVWIGVALPERDLLQDFLPLRLTIVSVALVALAFAIWRAFRVAGFYSKPLEQLEMESQRISQLQLEDPSEVKSNIREIQRLAVAHERMRLNLQNMLRMERDIQLARQIQQSTFPEEMPQLDGFEMAAWSEPAEETGGDTYDLIGYTFDLAGYDDASAEEQVRLAGAGKADRAVVLLADATGHGIGPALAVTQIRAMLRMSVRMRQGGEKFIYHLNDQLCADLPPDRFITAWIGEINADEGTIRMFSAGQGPILVYRAATQEVEVRQADAPPLGVVPDMQFEIPAADHLVRGDIVAVISDGIYEAMDPAGEMFGTQRVKDIITAHATARPNDILATLRDSVGEFTHHAKAADDQTIVLIKKV